MLGGSSTKEVSATRSYPNLAGQDTQYIPKTIEEDGRTLTLQTVNWQTDNTANMDGYAVGDRFTAVATYTGTATSSYVKGYTVTADYTGTVSRIALNKVRYVAILKEHRWSLFCQRRMKALGPPSLIGWPLQSPSVS